MRSCHSRVSFHPSLPYHCSHIKIAGQLPLKLWPILKILFFAVTKIFDLTKERRECNVCQRNLWLDCDAAG
jgi:hypothetical protein